MLPATSADAWLTDGLSRYAAAMYAEQSDGVSGLHNALDDFAVGALMYEAGTPIAQAQRSPLIRISTNPSLRTRAPWCSTCCAPNWATMPSLALLRDFYKQHDGKTATIDEFEKLDRDARFRPLQPDQPAFNLLSFSRNG